jgi:hypothetical protein
MKMLRGGFRDNGFLHLRRLRDEQGGETKGVRIYPQDRIFPIANEAIC